MTSLGFHGDAELAAGLVDLAVNVRQDPPPDWLAEPIAACMRDLARYPDPAPARAALAERHGRPAGEVLVTAGASQAFTLLAQALRAVRRPLVIHPQFTEPEAALRAAGHAVDRVILRPENGFTLDAHDIPPAADLVMIGNPTNPTSTLHPAATLEALARPGRTLVVDEAFMDAVPGEVESVSARSDLPGLIVIRSLTKTWALAGLRIGYLLGDPLVLATLRNAQPLWAVSSPALIAAAACSTPTAVRAAEQVAIEVAGDRKYLVAQLARIGIAVAGKPAAPFVLIRVDDGERLQLALRDRGIAIRSAGTFPGLDSNWLRIAVRTPELIDHLIEEIDNLK
jgi:histidinol-phosphate aminotransferase